MPEPSAVDDGEGRLVVISGPSGVGKTVLARRVAGELPGVGIVLTATTRPPRPREKNGRDYAFLSRERFSELERSGGFLEHACYLDDWYGTPMESLRAALQQYRIALLLIDVQGARQVRRKRPDAAFVFIAPPDEKSLERRLRERATDEDEEITRRIDCSRTELDQARSYDYVIVNDDLDEAARQLRQLLEQLMREGADSGAESRRAVHRDRRDGPR